MVYVGVPWEFNTLSVQLTTLRFSKVCSLLQHRVVVFIFVLILKC